MPVEGGILAVEEYRVIPVPDLHWRDTDISTVGGYCEATLETGKELISVMRDYKITHALFLGDVCDKGYRTQHELYSHRNLIQEINSITNDNAYLNLGNHFFIERDTNPELYWIQPNEKYKPVKPIYANKPLLRVEETLILGCVQFSFFHYNKNQKMYVRPRVPGIKYHCGLYHDDLIVPAHVRLDEGIRKNVQASYTRAIYDNIDIAAIGHIHTPVGEVMMQVDGRDIPVDIPGSLCVLTSKPADLHRSVKLPIYTITSNTFKKEYVSIELHTSLLRFSKQKEAKIANKSFIPQDLRNTENVGELIRRGTAGYLSAENYLELNGASEVQKRMYEAASYGRLDVPSAVKIITSKGLMDNG